MICAFRVSINYSKKSTYINHTKQDISFLGPKTSSDLRFPLNISYFLRISQNSLEIVPPGANLFVRSYEAMVSPQPVGDEIIDTSMLHVSDAFQIPDKPVRVAYPE
jgi:hypothetical protein